MTDDIKPNSGRVPVTTAEEVRHFAGDVADHTVIEILDLRPTIAELQAASLHARGQSGRPRASVEELSGPAALLYDLLMQDDIYLSGERG